MLAHVGQPEELAGFRAGRRLIAAGAHHALCVNVQVGNTGLDARCRGLERAMRAAGGTSRVLPVDDQSPADAGADRHGRRRQRDRRAPDPQRDERVARHPGHARRGPRRSVIIGTFDLGPDVLAAVRAGRLAFAVDQQPYLQGYWPIVMLAQRARYGLLPGQGELIPTGPNFVTRSNAAQVIRLSRRSIR